MFDYDNEDERPMVELLARKLRSKFDKYEHHAEAKKAAEAGKDGKANDGLSLKAMMAMEAKPETQEAFAAFQRAIAEAYSAFVESIPEGDEHVYANAFDTIDTMATAVKKTATDWAPTFKPATKTFTDGDLISDEALAELKEDCDKHFRLLVGSVDQLAGRVAAGDASVQSLIEQITGCPTTTRERDGKTQFSLALTRFRTRNPENVSASGGSKRSHLVLMVDGEQVPGNLFTEQTMKAFGISGADMLDRLKALSGPENKYEYGSVIVMEHNGTEYLVEVQQRDGDWIRPAE